MVHSVPEIIAALSKLYELKAGRIDRLTILQIGDSHTEADLFSGRLRALFQARFGNAGRGMQVYSSAACIGCHTITGNPMSMGSAGPNLTHFGSRATIGAGSFPNTPAYLALWIKNARMMKPGILMPTLGKGQYDPMLKQPVTTGGLDDQQIADIVAYLTSLK